MRHAGFRRFISRPIDFLFHPRDEDGQGLAEYAMILGFVAIACIAALTTLGAALPPWYQAVAGAL